MARIKPAKNVKISDSDALAILEWVFGKPKKVKLTAKDMTKTDKGYAQAFLVELLDASFTMGFIEALFKSATKAPSGPAKVIKSFLKGAGKNLVRYKDKDDLQQMMKEPLVYKSVLNSLARSHKSAWEIRLQTGKW